MVSNSITLAFIGLVLSTIASGVAKAELDPAGNLRSVEQNSEVAALISELIARGDVAFDPKTGALQLKRSVLSILDGYGSVSQKVAPTESASACSGTTGGSCMSPY